MEQILRTKYLQFILGAPVIMFILILGYNYHNNSINDIKENCSLTIGKLVRIHDGGVAFDLSADYEYYLGNHKYERTVKIMPNDKKSLIVLKSSMDTSNYFIRVIYSNIEPNRSLVDLSRVFKKKGSIDNTVPANFDRFY